MKQYFDKVDCCILQKKHCTPQVKGMNLVKFHPWISSQILTGPTPFVLGILVNFTRTYDFFFQFFNLNFITIFFLSI